MPELPVFEKELLTEAIRVIGPAQIFVRTTDQSGGPYVSAGRYQYTRPKVREAGLAALENLVGLGYVMLHHDDGRGRKAYELTGEGRAVAKQLPTAEE